MSGRPPLRPKPDSGTRGIQPASALGQAPPQPTPIPGVPYDALIAGDLPPGPPRPLQRDGAGGPVLAIAVGMLL